MVHIEQYKSWRGSEGDRSLHLIDMENLAGSTSFGIAEVVRIAARYSEVADVGPQDHIVVASSHRTASQTWFGWPPNVRRLVRSGANGADLASIDVIRKECVADRYARLVIASGDSIFAELAARLQSDGSAVTVVSRRTSLSRQLKFAVRDVRFLDVATKAMVVRLGGVS